MRKLSRWNLAGRTPRRGSFGRILRARPVVTARELKPTIWIDKVFFPRSVRGNYWSPGREEQNAGLISKIGRAVWEIRGPIDFGSYGAPNRP